VSISLPGFPREQMRRRRKGWGVVMERFIDISGVEEFADLEDSAADDEDGEEPPSSGSEREKEEEKGS